MSVGVSIYSICVCVCVRVKYEYLCVSLVTVPRQDTASLCAFDPPVHMNLSVTTSVTEAVVSLEKVSLAISRHSGRYKSQKVTITGPHRKLNTFRETSDINTIYYVSVLVIKA